MVFAIVLIIVAGLRLMRSMQEQNAAPLVASAYGYYSTSQGTGADYTKALELFHSVRNQYPSTRSGAIAQYYIGNCLANLGRNDEALAEYQAFVSKYAGDKFLLGLVYERMGYLYGELGKQADAVKAFEQSETLIGPGVSTVELARLYEASGNVTGSQQKYKLIADKLAGTAWAMEAMGKVQKIAP
ncbi:MAG TPA: tetratricopeptide repeat protein, partial [Nitrospirota bacterium]|nr:tetratricopeptide repeat protein [Nitrospirota bacterium]